MPLKSPLTEIPLPVFQDEDSDTGRLFYFPHRHRQWLNQDYTKVPHLFSFKEERPCGVAHLHSSIANSNVFSTLVPEIHHEGARLPYESTLPLSHVWGHNL